MLTENQRRGKNNRKRGNAMQAWVCREMGWMNVGAAGGPADGIGLAGDAMFSAQVKSGARFPGWMQAELDRLPRTGGRIPVLVIVETPGPGRKRRAVAVLDFTDFRDLHGDVT